MNDFVKRLLQKYTGGSSFKKNVLVMVIGRVTAQALPILLTPLLTRIYTPTQFGIFGVYYTIISIVSMISNGRYCLAIILPKDDERAKRLLLLSSVLTSIVCIAFTIMLFSWNGFYDLLGSPSLKSYSWVIILSTLFIGLYENLYYYALREKAFKILTTNIILQALVLVSTRIILGYLGFTDSGLIYSYLLGYAASYILMVVRLKIPVFQLIKEFSVHTYWKLMKDYHKFPKYSLLADTISTTANMIPNVLINRIFGAEYTGYYSMSDKILGAPLWLITSSVGDVFRQEASEQFREKGSCYQVFKKTVRATFLLGIIPFIVIFIFSPYVIPWLLGAQWAPVGDYIRIFTLVYFMEFIVRPVYPVLYIIRKQNYNAIFRGIQLVAILISFGVGIATKNIYTCLISWTILSSISYLIILFFAFKFTKEAKYDPNEDA